MKVNYSVLLNPTHAVVGTDPSPSLAVANAATPHFSNSPVQASETAPGEPVVEMIQWTDGSLSSPDSVARGSQSTATGFTKTDEVQIHGIQLAVFVARYPLGPLSISTDVMWL